MIMSAGRTAVTLHVVAVHVPANAHSLRVDVLLVITIAACGVFSHGVIRRDITTCAGPGISGGILRGLLDKAECCQVITIAVSDRLVHLARLHMLIS